MNPEKLMKIWLRPLKTKPKSLMMEENTPKSNLKSLKNYIIKKLLS